MARILLWLWRRGGIASRRTGEDVPAIGKLDEARVAGLRAVLGQHTLDGDLVAGLQGVHTPTVSRQGVGRPTFALPGLHASLLVLHIQVNPDVRIGPLELR